MEGLSVEMRERSNLVDGLREALKYGRRSNLVVVARLEWGGCADEGLHS